MRISKNWLATSLVTTALMLTACGNSVDDLMQRAASQQADGLYQSAIADYRNVLNEQPDHAEARFGLGEVGLLVGDYAGAESSLRQAADLGISEDRVQPLLATALLRQNKTQQVIELIKPDTASDPTTRANLLAAIGQAHYQEERLEEARELLNQALETDPRNVRALVTLARMAHAANDSAEAASLTNQALDIDPDSSAAWLMRGALARQARRVDDAVAAYQQVLDLPVKDISIQEQYFARGAQIETLLFAQRTDEASRQAETMRNLNTRHPYANYLSGVIAYANDDIETASNRLQTVLSIMPDNLYAKRLMGAIRARQGQYAQSISLLREVVAAQPEDVQARLMLASAYREFGQENQATRVLSAGIRFVADDPQALTALARGAGEDIDNVISELQRAALTDPEARRGSLGLAQALMSDGNVNPATSMLQQMEPSDDDEFTRRQFLALATLRSGNPEEALTQAEDLVRDYPDNATAFNLLGGVHMTMERFGAAQQAFNRSIQLAPNSAQTLFNLGLLETAQGNQRQAADYLKQGLEHAPGNAPIMLRIAELERQLGNRDETLTWLQRAVASNPNSPEATLALTRFQVAYGSSSDAVAASDEAVRTAPENAAALGFQGIARLGAQDPEGAVRSLTRARDINPNDPKIQFQLARAQSAMGDDEATKHTLTRLVEDHPELTEPRLTLARSQLRRQDPNAALETLKPLEDQPEATSGQSAMLTGHAHSNLGNRDAAIQAYERAVAAGHMDAFGPLVANRAEAGYEEPAKPLEDWVAENPDSAGARLALGNWLIGREDYARAAHHYAALADMTSRDNPNILNNLAWAYQQLGDERALPTAREAHALAPDNAAIMDTLGWIELGAGNAQRARDLLQQASAASPDNATILYHYGVALAQTGASSQARETLTQALGMDTGADWAAEARKVLDGL